MELPRDVLRGDGFAVWIAVDGSPCANYGMEYEEADAVAGPQVSCWIASQANKVRADSTYWDRYLMLSPSCLLAILYQHQKGGGRL